MYIRLFLIISLITIIIANSIDTAYITVVIIYPPRMGLRSFNLSIF